MNLPNCKKLIEQNECLQISIEERKQALLLQLNCIKNISLDFCLIDQYFKAQDQYKDNQSNYLLNCQSSMLLERQNRCQILRYQQRIAQLRDLLASKEDEIQFQKNKSKIIKNQKAHLQNLLQFDYQAKLQNQLMKEIAAKNKLSKQISQLQMLIGMPFIQVKQNSLAFPQLDLEIQQCLLAENEKYELLSMQCAKLEQQLCFQTCKYGQIRLRYAQINKIVNISQTNKYDYVGNSSDYADNKSEKSDYKSDTNDKKSDKTEITSSQLSVKTIEQSSDQD